LGGAGAFSGLLPGGGLGCKPGGSGHRDCIVGHAQGGQKNQRNGFQTTNKICKSSNCPCESPGVEDSKEKKAIKSSSKGELGKIIASSRWKRNRDGEWGKKMKRQGGWLVQTGNYFERLTIERGKKKRKPGYSELGDSQNQIGEHGKVQG